MRKLVTVSTIEEKKEIEGADAIESVRVRGWWVVAKKGQFSVGDYCLYFEIDSFLPIKPEYEFLLRGSKPKKMLVDGKEIEGIRLKTIRLRGSLSQGLVMPVPAGMECVEGDDVSEELGVIKYEIPIPAALSGKVKGNFPAFIPKTDEERIQNMPDILSGFYMAEKLDGSSVTFYKKDGSFGVCSRNLELEEGESTQWKLARKYELAEKLPFGIAIQCELVGEGIQGNPLKISSQDIYCFNAYVIGSGRYLDYKDFIALCESIGVKTVPILDDHFTVPSSLDEMLKLAEGKSAINPESEREGVVIRPKVEMIYNGSRLSFKAISNKYLEKCER